MLGSTNTKPVAKKSLALFMLKLISLSLVSASEINSRFFPLPYLMGSDLKEP